MISLTAIPLSLVAAIVVLTSFGVTINTMVLAGLVIALGEVVDDAIIDVENIVRRLRLNRAAKSPQSAFQVVVQASLEVRSAVVYATLIVTLVFLPVFFLDGVAGSFFRPFALAYVLSILASLLVALVVTPAMSYLLLSGDRQTRHEAPFASVLRRAYSALLPRLVRYPYAVVASLPIILVLTVALSTRLGSEFLPEFHETDFLMHFLERPGTSIEAMDRMTVRAANNYERFPASLILVRTSDVRRSPTKSLAPTLPNFGLASIRRWITARLWEAFSRRWKAIQVCTAMCRRI